MPCWSHSTNRTGELQTCGTACHGSWRTLYGRSVDPSAVPDPALAGYRAPSRRVLDKVIHHLDEHCTAFIRLSPFATLATASADGWPEVSPPRRRPGLRPGAGPYPPGAAG